MNTITQGTKGLLSPAWTLAEEAGAAGSPRFTSGRKPGSVEKKAAVSGPPLRLWGRGDRGEVALAFLRNHAHEEDEALIR